MPIVIDSGPVLKMQDGDILMFPKIFKANFWNQNTGANKNKLNRYITVIHTTSLT